LWNILIGKLLKIMLTTYAYQLQLQSPAVINWKISKQSKILSR
jgi:hypothetical protein